MLTLWLSKQYARAASLQVVLFVLLFGLSVQTPAQNPAPTPQAAIIESGKFRLHKFEQAIGEETYEISRDGDSVVVKSNFKFTDRGTPVPLTTTLRTSQDLTPEAFEIKGSTARGSTIDTAVEIKGNAATIREGKETRQAPVPARFFTIAGYAPVTMQMMLMRYLARKNVKGALATLPGGAVTVERRGKDQIRIGDKTVELDRYSMGGLIWGRESLWLDKQENLVALVGVDAEFDHFEALRDDYEPALPVFVNKAADDGMAALAEISNRTSAQRKGALVITNANLIDGTGSAPVADAMVVIENGRITAAGPRSIVKVPKGAKVFDAQGRYVLPGLWEMHAHFEQVEWGPVYLAAGVTTVRDVGNEFEFITAVRDAIKNGRGLGPRILLAGIVDGDSHSALGVIRANTPAEARAVVNRYHDAGFQQIKIYSSIKLDILKEITAEAHRLGMTVTGHVPRGMNAIQAVEAGMDQINHIQYLPPVLLPRDFKPQPGVVPKIDFDSPDVKKTIQFFKDHNTVFDPTMVVFEWFLHPARVPFSEIEPGAAKLPRELYAPINNTGVGPEREATGRDTIKLFLDIIGALHRAGLQIVVGTDQVVPGAQPATRNRTIRASRIYADGSDSSGNHRSGSRDENG